MKVKSQSEITQSCPTPRDPIPTRLLHPWDFPGKSTGVGCHCLLRKVARVGSKCWLYHIPEGTGTKQGHERYWSPAQTESLGPPPSPVPQVISNDECGRVCTKFRREEDVKHNIHKLHICRSVPGIINYITHGQFYTRTHVFMISLMHTLQTILS